MSYQPWSVVAFEVPTSAKWNILGSNDASFNNGIGIGNNAIVTRHISNLNITTEKINNGAVTPIKLINNFKARATRNSGNQSVTNLIWTKMQLPDKTYDPNNNFDTINHRYIAPVGGKYLVVGRVHGSGANFDLLVAIYRNGSLISQGTIDDGENYSDNATQVVDIIDLRTNDFIELFSWHNHTTVANYNPTSSLLFFCIHLLSQD